MTVMTGWDLFEDLRAPQDEMLGMAMGRRWRPRHQNDTGTSPMAWAPAADISERKDAYVPSHIEADKIEASVQGGVLQILVPKAPDTQAKHIQVRGVQGRAILPRAVARNGS